MPIKTPAAHQGASPPDRGPTLVASLLPSATLVIGTTGHRSNRLLQTQMQALRNTMEALLSRIEECRAAVERDHAADFELGAGRTVLLSMLATGADSLAAEAALALRFELQAILPFGRQRYLEDFTADEDRRRFDRLSGSAARV